VAQLLIYQHFIKGVEGARFYFLKESSKNRVMLLPQELSATGDELMVAIKERLDEIIGGIELLPDWNCQECQYCLFQALCGREPYYKALRGNN
jgi:CRISPR/Cas system-associated exonuclease Cas4 (RecB family)